MSDETCGTGPTHPKLVQWFPDMRCDRQKGHPGAHRMIDGADLNWWLEGCIGATEDLVLSMLADAATERAKVARKAASDARRRAKKDGRP